MNKRRLLELAGMPIPADMESMEHEEKSEPGEHRTEEHLDEETHCFKKAHDALEKLMEFLRSQESFEKKRGKEPEYEKMEQCAEELMQEMKKHLSEY